jgi:DnaK suppressor protein
MAIAELAGPLQAPGTRREYGAEARARFRRMLEELHVSHTAHLTRIDGEVAKGSDPVDEHVMRTQSFSRHWLLFEIEDALVRLDDGTYGVCEDCRTPIPSGRLETIPYARRCLNCQRTSAK